MKRSLGVVAAGTLAMVALGGGVASGHETEYPSEVIIEDGDFVKGFGFAYGFVGSKANPKCAKNREVQLRSTNGTSSTILDEGKTSKNGGFYLFGNVPKGAIGIDVKMLKENLGDNGHKHICTGDVAFVSTVP